MALRWAKTGAAICIADLNAERGDQIVKLIEKAGGKAHFIHCDITNEENLLNARSFVEAKMQGVDIIINCAGVATAGVFARESIDTWNWVLNINVLGMVRVSQIFLPLFEQQKSGYFVNVASQAGLTSAPMMASYNASKAAVIALSETMKLELAAKHINVSVLCPAFVKTNLDESLPDEQKDMQPTVTKLLERAHVSAEQVADDTYNAVKNNQFLIVTHREGRWVYRIKRWFPRIYFYLMANRIRKAAHKKALACENIPQEEKGIS